MGRTDMTLILAGSCVDISRALGQCTIFADVNVTVTIRQDVLWMVECVSPRNPVRRCILGAYIKGMDKEIAKNELERLQRLTLNDIV
jgi:hypothetical protein